ncbi:VTC domain-containing protein [Nitrospirota bacterium]
MENKLQLHFNRFEFKYVMPLALREEFESELGYFMALDPYVSSVKGNKYFVRSLYYDNSSFTNYYEKIDGIMHRYKYRIRTYTNDINEACNIFLEIKGRYNALVFKHRVQLPDSTKALLEEGSTALISALADDLGEDKVFKRFMFDSLRMRLEPKALVDYYRRPYVSKYAPDFRVTFDDSLVTTSTNLLFSRPTDRRRNVLAGYTIVEVKFRRHMPSWFHRLIQYYELYRVSVSKFCHGVEKIELVDMLE